MKGKYEPATLCKYLPSQGISCVKLHTTGRSGPKINVIHVMYLLIHIQVIHMRSRTDASVIELPYFIKQTIFSSV